MRAAILGFVAAVVVIGGLVALDSKALNWLIPEETSLAELQRDVAKLERDVRRLDREGQRQPLVIQNDQADALARLARLYAVTARSLERPGEAVAGTDPNVIACVDYILDGTGSFVECGFERVAP